MAAVVTYDVSDKQDAVKARMVKSGYFDRWTHEGKKYYLPYTTLYGPKVDSAQALADIKAAAHSERVTLERAIALDLGTWAGIEGEPHP